MLFHFVILSGESEDFVREVIIDSESTFLDFHELIQKSVDYDTSQIASFFISDENWGKNKEVTLLSMDNNTNADELIMHEVKLQELLSEPKSRLIYQFDFFSNRGFFIELLSVSEDRKLDKSSIIKAEGKVPEQILLDDIGLDEISSLLGLTEDDDDEFKDEFNDVRLDDIDPDSFEEYF